MGLASFGLVVCVAIIKQADKKKKRERAEFERLTQKLLQEKEIMGSEYESYATEYSGEDFSESDSEVYSIRK